MRWCFSEFPHTQCGCMLASGLDLWGNASRTYQNRMIENECTLHISGTFMHKEIGSRRYCHAGFDNICVGIHVHAAACAIVLQRHRTRGAHRPMKRRLCASITHSISLNLVDPPTRFSWENASRTFDNRMIVNECILYLSATFMYKESGWRRYCQAGFENIRKCIHVHEAACCRH